VLHLRLPWQDFRVRFLEPKLGFLIALPKCEKNCAVPRQVPMCFLCLIQDCLIKVTLKLSFCHRLSPRTALLFPSPLRQEDTLSKAHVELLLPLVPSVGCHNSRVQRGRTPQKQSRRKTGSFPKLSKAGSLDSCHFCHAGEGLSAAFTVLPAPLALPCAALEAKRWGGSGGGRHPGSKGFIKARRPRQMSGLQLHFLSIFPICSLQF